MKVRGFWVLAATVPWFLACSSGETPPATEAPVAATGAPPAEAPAASPSETWAAFSASFVQAAVAGDGAALASMSADPFKTRGPMDEDPEVTYAAADLPVLYKHFFKSPGNSNVEQTELDDLKAQAGFHAGDPDLGSVRIGDLVFEPRDGTWKATFAYLEYETADAIKAELGR